MLDCRWVKDNLGQYSFFFDTQSCRAERNLEQVCSEEEYRKVFNRLNGLPRDAKHLIIQLGNTT